MPVSLAKPTPDQQLFDTAVWYARHRAYLLALADDPQRERRTNWTRRQCLAKARQAERRVFDLSIRAEQRCLRELRQTVAAGAAA